MLLLLPYLGPKPLDLQQGNYLEDDCLKTIPANYTPPPPHTHTVVYNKQKRMEIYSVFKDNLSSDCELSEPEQLGGSAEKTTFRVTHLYLQNQIRLEGREVGKVRRKVLCSNTNVNTGSLATLPFTTAMIALSCKGVLKESNPKTFFNVFRTRRSGSKGEEGWVLIFTNSGQRLRQR